MAQPRTAKYLLLQLRLGRDLSAYVAEARKAERDWRSIAADLRALTGLDISHETLRVWFADSEAVA
jgi:hypothetical protein